MALEQRKQFSLRIRKMHQRKIRNWKSQLLFLKLPDTSQWKPLKTMVATLHGHSRHSLTQRPSPNDFADMLENSFGGAVAPPGPQILMSEPPFTMEELKHALGRFKNNKPGDEAGLVAELVLPQPNY